jgi:hypothetical protein
MLHSDEKVRRENHDAMSPNKKHNRRARKQRTKQKNTSTAPQNDSQQPDAGSTQQPAKPSRSVKVLPPHIYQQVTLIADELGEADPSALSQLRRMAAACGIVFLWRVLDETRAIEAAGGLFTQNGARRRSPGGVFFHLAKRRLSQEGRGDDMARVFYPSEHPVVYRHPGVPAWVDRHTLVSHGQQPGEAGRVKITITLTGSPVSFDEHEDFTVAVFSYTPSLNYPPKGVPLPDTLPSTTYTVYIGGRMWRRIRPGLGQPGKILIVEGAPFWDHEQQTMVIVATFCILNDARKKQNT